MNNPNNSKPGEKKRDRALYARLMESYQADRIGIFVDFDRLNHPRSPVWNPWENIGPLLVLLGGSLASMFFIKPLTVGVLAGTAMMVLGVLFYLFVMRPWIAQRLYRRATDAATENLHNWNLLWKMGGLVITLNYMNKTRCVAPDGDWRAFVTRYLPEMELEGLEVYNSFRKGPEEEKEHPTTTKYQDIHM
jgi:hypothetical protein